MQEVFERLVQAGIQILPIDVGPRHIAFERGGYVALVERVEDRLLGIGAAGQLTPGGFAALVWKGDGPYFVGKKHDQQATDEEVANTRAFQKDLENALRS
jgi:hypothetical protein